MTDNIKKIRLNSFRDRNVINDDYRLNACDKYIINVDDEIEFQNAIFMSFNFMGPPPAIKNYYAWLYENGFNVESPNPTNEFVSKFYGIKPLWKTCYSQGIVVKAEGDDDYYIVMECNGNNKGYKHSMIILTLGGCY